MKKLYPFLIMKKILLLLLLFGASINAQIVSIPDANFKAALVNANLSNTTAFGPSGYAVIDTNSDGEIQVSEAQAIIGLQFQSMQITDFTGIEAFTNLQFFGSYDNNVTVLNLNGLLQLNNINVSGSYGTATVYSFSNLPALTNFSFYYSNITSLTVSNLNALQNVNIWGNPNLTSLHLVSLPSMVKVWGNDCAVNDLSITNSPQLEDLNLSGSNLTSIDITNFPSLKKLNLDGNLLTDISGFSNLNFLEELNVQNNQISNIVMPPMPSLRFLICGSNGFPSINLSGFPQLRGLAINNNTISTVDFSNNIYLQQLNISQNTIASADFSMLANLTTFSGDYNLFTEIDLSGSPLLNGLSFSNNPNLTHVNLKSGTVSTVGYSSSSYFNLGSLVYVCVDEGDTFNYNATALPNLVVTSYCSFTPGGDYNTITGSTSFDLNNNGCDSSDIQVQNLKVNINDGTQSGSTFSNTSGYRFYTEAGSFDVTPQIENPTYFNVTPTTFTASFPDDNNNIHTQNFCLSANGVHSDVEMVIVPVVGARPGFDATYQLVYRNIGNQTETATLSFNYDENILDFVSSSIAPTATNSGLLTYTISELHPFQSGTITITLNANSPTDSPAVNIGDLLTFNSIIAIINDENLSNNNFTFEQTVVGSFDPNNISCLEGEIQPQSAIGDYLHYVVNFENTGNFYAENVVVKINIDPAKYDIQTLQLMNTSHPPVYTTVANDTVEFAFIGINLAAASGNPPVGGHGNVLFKIKSKEDLNNGDSVAKQANIYFDYNAPIETNLASTTFQSLSNSIFEIDESVVIHPNPTNGNININSNFNIKTIELYDIQGRILETSLENSSTTTLDISNRENGIYFLKINTENGSKVEKIVKE
jgi:hypothetical protein